MSRTELGPTPAGGDKAVITYLDAAGSEVSDADRAAQVKLIEYSGDHEIRRSYMSRVGDAPADRPASEVAYDQPSNIDWYSHEASWNLRIEVDGQHRAVRTKDDLLKWLKLDLAPVAEQRAGLAEVSTLHSFEAAPDSLQREIVAWLENTRPEGVEPRPPASTENTGTDEQ